jgi:Glycosyl hydrolases family 32 N-terminal domain
MRFLLLNLFLYRFIKLISFSVTPILTQLPSQFKKMLNNRESNSKLVRSIELLPRGRNTAAKVARAIRTQDYKWDPWILKDGDLYRMFYLMAPKPTPDVDFWSQGTIYGAVSGDLRTWEPTGIVLAPNLENEWESGRMLAGSTYKKDGIYYLFYGSSGGDKSLKDERIGLATSIDGINWQRVSNDYFFSEAEWSQWYGRQADTGHFHWRDPYIVRDRETGKYCMFMTAHLKHDTNSRYQGCVAVATANEFTGPYTLQPPVAGSQISGIEDWPFTEMERPQVIYRHGKYHLFFSCWPWNLNPAWLKQLKGHRLRESSLYWFVADRLTGPYQPVSDFPFVPGSTETGMYATNFLDLEDQQAAIAFGWNHRIYTLEVFSQFTVSFDQDSIQIVRTKNF